MIGATTNVLACNFFFSAKQPSAHAADAYLTSCLKLCFPGCKMIVNVTEVRYFTERTFNGFVLTRSPWNLMSEIVASWYTGTRYPINIKHQVHTRHH